jgi:hypothetical protein
MIAVSAALEQQIPEGKKRMHIVRDSGGDFVLDPVELSSKFVLKPDDFRSRMQRGLVLSRVETGFGDDEGTTRLSLRLGNRLWQAILDAEDRVTSETLTFVHGNGAREL